MYSAIVVKPRGYISKIGLEGTMSDTGPNMMDVSRKSYTLGACNSTRSALGIRIQAFPCSVRPDARQRRLDGTGMPP